MQGLDYLQKPQIQNRIEQVKKAQDDASEMKAILALFREIRNSSKSIIDEIGGGIAVSNLDEVTTALHNETVKNTKLLLTALKDIQLSNDKQAKILTEITTETQTRFDEEFQTVRIRRPHDKVSVSNLHEIPLAEEVRINNLGDLKELFDSLEKRIENSLNINLPAPQVNIEAPIVNVPESSVNIPEVDFEPVLNELRDGFKKIKTNNKSNPVFVRMTDLDKMLDKLEEIREASRNVMLGFPGLIGLRDVSGGIADPSTFGSNVSSIASTLGDGSKNVTTAGTRVQLSSTSIPCKWVIITAKVGNTGTVYIGGSTVATARGKPLVNLQEIIINVNDVSKVWMDSDSNGDGVTFCYGL